MSPLKTSVRCESCRMLVAGAGLPGKEMGGEESWLLPGCIQAYGSPVLTPCMWAAKRGSKKVGSMTAALKGSGVGWKCEGPEGTAKPHYPCLSPVGLSHLPLTPHHSRVGSPCPSKAPAGQSSSSPQPSPTWPWTLLSQATHGPTSQPVPNPACPQGDVLFPVPPPAPALHPRGLP